MLVGKGDIYNNLFFSILVMRKICQILLLLFCILSSKESAAQCSSPPVFLGPDTSLCAGQTMVLTPGSVFSYDSYLWNTGSPAATKFVNAPGLYWVEATKFEANVIVNGDFEQGNTGFSTDYTVGTGGTYGQLSQEGTYAISTSPSLVHNNFNSCADHTPAPGTKMMIVNGAGTANTNVWCQTVPIQPNTDYHFVVWVSSALFDNNVAILQFSINGSPLGSTFSPSPSGCVWSQFFQVWNSGTNTSAQICILNQNTSVSGNDFMIDDITFRPICKSRDSIVVTYNPYPVVNLGADQNTCSGDIVTLDAQNSGANYVWDDGSNGQTRNVTATGNYSVTVTGPGGCSASDNVNVSFDNPPNAGLDTTMVYCNSIGGINLVSYLHPSADLNGVWESSNVALNGNLTTNGDINLSSLSGIYNLNYTKSANYCPTDTAKYTLHVNTQPNGGANNQDHVCNENGLVYDLNTLRTPIVPSPSYLWLEPTNLAVGAFNAQNGFLDLSNLAGDSYDFKYVELADSMCINDSVTIRMDVTENPQLAFVANHLTGCEALPVQFYNQSTYGSNSTHNWLFSNGVVSNASDSVEVLFEHAGLYTVELIITTDNLCSNNLMLTDYIEVFPKPTAAFQANPNKIYSDDPSLNLVNESILGTSFLWSFGDGNISTLPNPSHTYPAGIVGGFDIWLYVTSSHGCLDSTRRTIEIADQLLYFIPNAFTPDNDQFNNTFLPIMTAGFEPDSYSFSIYNRWGELIFETRDTNVGWDGTFKGKVLPIGQYTWILKLTDDSSDEKYTDTGHLNLIR